MKKLLKGLLIFEGATLLLDGICWRISYIKGGMSKYHAMQMVWHLFGIDSLKDEDKTSETTTETAEE